MQEKRFWRRYIWLWIYYAVYEELDVKDPEKTREVWRACLEIVPHKAFTFAKLWIMFAQFEVRQLNLGAARKIMVSLARWHKSSGREKKGVHRRTVVRRIFSL